MCISVPCYMYVLLYELAMCIMNCEVLKFYLCVFPCNVDVVG